MRDYIAAGSFYPLEPRLSKMLDEFTKNVKKIRCAAIVSPHAGYVYSGETAGAVFSSIEFEKVETVIILGPNHTGHGESVAVSSDNWKTPLGEIKCDKEFVEKLVDNVIKEDETAHQDEHSIEVQIPFIQKIKPNIKIVCICLKDQRLETAEHIARKILDAEKELGRAILVVASSDFTHYESSERAEKKDKGAIEYILHLDYKGFYNYVRENNVTICGYGPIMVATAYAKLKGLKNSKLLKYTNSGEVTGDYLQVVGYASIIFEYGDDNE